jgi:hypothetical protein
MRPVQFKTIELKQAAPRFDDGDPHLRSISPPGQRRGGLWLLSQRGAPAVRVKIKIDKG